tara:strand:+ start:8381 stop:9322 length:942 start_codon:yes stop_codon:yes gene_type:complete
MKLLKYFVRSVVGTILSPVGNYLTKNKLTIFCYHDVSSSPSEFSHKYDLNVSPDTFDFQIDFINKNFNVISPDDLSTNKMPKNAALITFDDGFKSYFTNAVPILKKYETPSLIFLNMAPIKGEIFWSGLITYLCDKKSDFVKFLNLPKDLNTKGKPKFLFCSQEIVNSYLESKNKNFKEEVDEFVGEFGDVNDLKSLSEDNLVFYGNHLYKHYVPLLLSDNKLLEMYNKNEKLLEKFPNYRKLFSFPFGQPETCFSMRQVELLLDNGCQKIFTSYPYLNTNIKSKYLHRIPLHARHSNKGSIWFNIFRRNLRF